MPDELITGTSPEESTAGEASSYLLLIGPVMSFVVAVYIFKLLVRVWAKAQQDKQDRELLGLHSGGSRGGRKDAG